MIIRVVRRSVEQAAADVLARAFGTAHARAASSTPGLVRLHAGTRPTAEGLEVIGISTWASPERAVEETGGRGSSDLDALFPGAGGTVAYYEVDEMIVRPQSGTAGVLRFSAGRIAAGRDSEIQDEIRVRVRTLGEGMREAYVARRLVGADVEVVFASTWVDDARAALEVPLWPDISARYVTFELSIYRSLGSDPATGA